MHPRLERTLVGLARLTLTGFYRRVEVLGRERLPAAGRPAVVVANHFYGFVDPVIVTAVMGRVPRFLAKATLWKVPGLGNVLGGLGVLPVARRQDRLDRAANEATFDAAAGALRAGSTVAIFPEGTAHDEPQLLPLRTGAARIALAARRGGARGLLVVPIGITFEAKLALRSRVSVAVGEPVDLDRWVLRHDGAAEPTVVRALTEHLAAQLAALTPGFDSRDEARVLTRAAEIAARRDGDEPALTEIAALARRLGLAEPEAKLAVAEAVGRYTHLLSAVGLSDADVAADPSPTRLAAEALAVGARTVVLAPWAVLGAVVNGVPYLAVRFAGRLARKPAEQGTMRLLAALAGFPAGWTVTAWVIGRRRGGWQGVAVAAVAAVSGYATVVEFERYERLRRAWRGAERRSLLRGDVGELLSARAELVAAVAAATGMPVTGS